MPLDRAMPAEDAEFLGGLAALRRISLEVQHDLIAGRLISDARWEALARAFEAAAQECRDRIPVAGEVEAVAEQPRSRRAPFSASGP